MLADDTPLDLQKLMSDGSRVVTEIAAPLHDRNFEAVALVVVEEREEVGSRHLLFAFEKFTPGGRRKGHAACQLGTLLVSAEKRVAANWSVVGYNK